jgi:hypothetical protein
MTGLNMVAQTCNPSYSGGRVRRIMVQGEPWHNYQETLSEKQAKNKRTEGVAYVLDLQV